MRNQRGAPELAVCGVFSTEQADTVSHALRVVDEGAAVPVFADHVRRFSTLDPVLGSAPRPLYLALKEALELVALRLALAGETAGS
ncbi:MAG: hypothetical protein AB2A00_05435 [Myxococcota bacterium]